MSERKPLYQIKEENRTTCRWCGKTVFEGKTIDKNKSVLLDSSFVPFSYIGSGALVTPVEALIPHAAVCRRRK